MPMPTGRSGRSEKLSQRFGSDFDFYETEGVRALWKRFDTAYEFIYWASRFHGLSNFVPTSASSSSRS